MYSGLTKSQINLLKELEPSIKDLPFEQSFVINSHGKVLYHVGGDEKNSDMKISLKSKTPKYTFLKNSLIVHNHPMKNSEGKEVGTPFSINDIASFCRVPSKEIRVISSTKLCRVILKPEAFEYLIILDKHPTVKSIKPKSKILNQILWNEYVATLIMNYDNRKKMHFSNFLSKVLFEWAELCKKWLTYEEYDL